MRRKIWLLLCRKEPVSIFMTWKNIGRGGLEEVESNEDKQLYHDSQQGYVLT